MAGFFRLLPLPLGQKSVSGCLGEGPRECLLFPGTPPLSGFWEVRITTELTLGCPNSRRSVPGRWLSTSNPPATSTSQLLPLRMQEFLATPSVRNALGKTHRAVNLGVHEKGAQHGAQEVFRGWLLNGRTDSHETPRKPARTAHTLSSEDTRLAGFRFAYS